MDTIGTEKLIEKLDNNEVMFIEVLKEENYNKSHNKEARNTPFKKISFESQKKIGKDDNLVDYCSDKDCKVLMTKKYGHFQVTEKWMSPNQRERSHSPPGKNWTT